MPVLVFVAPFFTENARRYLHAVASLPGADLALVSQEPVELLSPEQRAPLRAFVRVADALQTDQLVAAVTRIQGQLGPVHRLIAILEQIQVPLAEARERLGIPGMLPGPAQRFRDKNLMKDRLREAGLPVARHGLAASEEEARRFVAEVGYPVVVKPPAGAASQATFRVEGPDALGGALREAMSAGGGPVLIEEFITGKEHSFDAFMLHGRMVFHSVSRYSPTPLEVMQNPWMQWVVVLPRELDAPEFDDIRAAGARTLEVLGLETGMCHLEWFRRRDGSVVVSEVAARPPGAQIPTMIARAHDVDCIGAWARLMAFEHFDPFPPRRYAVGAAYLRGQGSGRVRAVHGIDVIERELGHLVTDARLPEVGQEKAPSYEGEGFIVVRHPETRVVEEALHRIISTARVELG